MRLGTAAYYLRITSKRPDRKRVKELERDLLLKDRALAEKAAPLMLPKKVATIFHNGEDE